MPAEDGEDDTTKTITEKHFERKAGTSFFFFGKNGNNINIYSYFYNISISFIQTRCQDVWAFGFSY